MNWQLTGLLLFGGFLVEVSLVLLVIALAFGDED